MKAGAPLTKEREDKIRERVASWREGWSADSKSGLTSREHGEDAAALLEEVDALRAELIARSDAECRAYKTARRRIKWAGACLREVTDYRYILHGESAELWDTELWVLFAEGGAEARERVLGRLRPFLTADELQRFAVELDHLCSS